MEQWPIIEICDSTWIKGTKLKGKKRSHSSNYADVAFDQTEELKE